MSIFSVQSVLGRGRASLLDAISIPSEGFSMKVTKELLREVLERIPAVQYAEIRYHERTLNEVRVRRGIVEEARSVTYDGAGIRVLVEGAWGFSSTSDVSPGALWDAAQNAQSMARVSSSVERERGVLVTRIAGFPNPITGEFSGVIKGGYLIRNGQISHPLKETTMAGNIFELPSTPQS